MNRNINHTPGPWIIGQGADGYPIVHTGPDTFSPSGQGVAHVCKRAMCRDHDANAHLIAAAPELLEALRALVDWAREHTSPRDENSPHALLVRAAEVLAKAEGR